MALLPFQLKDPELLDRAVRVGDRLGMIENLWPKTGRVEVQFDPKGDSEEVDARAVTLVDDDEIKGTFLERRCKTLSNGEDADLSW